MPSANPPDLAPHRSRFAAALVEGDVISAAAEITGLLGRGVARTTIYERVMAPALHEVGELWARGELSIAEEHMASSVARAVLEQVAQVPPAGPARAAVVACAPGETHTLGARMVADCLTDSGWRVWYLGASTPAHEVAAFAGRRGVTLLALSASLADHLPGVRRLATEIGPERSARIVLGGAATQGLRASAADLGVDAVCDDLSACCRMAGRLAACDLAALS